MSQRAYDSYQPRQSRASPPRPPQAKEAMYHFGARTNNRHDFSFRPRTAERNLLRHLPDSKEIETFPSDTTGHKFRNVENMTDSEEEPMDEDSDDGENQVKRRKLDNGVAKISAPKWSNPDPYTSLPPAPESSGNHVDVVKLIRKARNEPLNTQATNAAQDDYISFDSLADTSFAPPRDAPIGPRADVNGLSLPGSRQTQTLGKRKRFDDYDTDELMGNPGRGVEYHANGQILAKWQPSSNVSAAPWLQQSKPDDSPIVALHKEVVDFYTWVKPDTFEQTVREELISRLANMLRRWRPGQLRSFGSYAAGLYLPTGDMDLVYNMTGFNVTPRKMHELGAFLDRNGLTLPGSVKVIGRAKVPIIKFVDRVTGLRVDLSFNNNTGVVAIETFKKWQALYPGLPVIVAIVKQFLMIRGLNDNSVGGLGGFATICMVTCLIQNLPTPGHQNLGELLLEFFNLYGNLIDFKRVGIRLDPPGFIDKRSYSLIREDKPDRLMIIDPNRPDNNITGGSNEVRRIFHLFSKTFEQLSSRLNDFASQEYHDAGFSFLSDIIGGDFTAYYDQRKRLHAVHQQLYPNEVLPPPPPPLSTPPTGAIRKENNAIGDVTTKVVLTKNNDANLFKDDSSNVTPSDTGSQSKNKGQKRLEQFRRLFPDLVPKLRNRKSLSVPQALEIGGWTNKETMTTALKEAEKNH